MEKAEKSKNFFIWFKMYEIGFQIVSDKKLIIIPEKQGPGSLG